MKRLAIFALVGMALFAATAEAGYGASVRGGRFFFGRRAAVVGTALVDPGCAACGVAAQAALLTNQLRSRVVLDAFGNPIIVDDPLLFGGRGIANGRNIRGGRGVARGNGSLRRGNAARGVRSGPRRAGGRRR